MIRRQRPGGWYAYPEHVGGVSGVLRRLLWHLGFDPLTVRERLAQIDRERGDWKRWLGECEEERDKLLETIRTVLDDDETGAGGWGPDVTMAGVLRSAYDDVRGQL